MTDKEKNNRLRLKTKLPMWNNEVYLNYLVVDRLYFVGSVDDTVFVKSIFTDSEVDNMDIVGFEKVEVED